MLFDDLKPAFRRVDLMDMKNICGLFAGKDLVCIYVCALKSVQDLIFKTVI